jgi:bifunctional non-homologous end joining protein LigD
VIGKRLGSIYEPGERSGAWIKLRTNMEQEFVIGGYIPGARGFDALLVGVYENNEFIFVAKVKNGFASNSGRALPGPQGIANCPVPLQESA